MVSGINTFKALLFANWFFGLVVKNQSSDEVRGASYGENSR